MAHRRRAPARRPVAPARFRTWCPPNGCPAPPARPPRHGSPRSCGIPDSGAPRVSTSPSSSANGGGHGDGAPASGRPSSSSSVSQPTTATRQSVPTAHRRRPSPGRRRPGRVSPPLTVSMAAAEEPLPTSRLARRSEARSRAPAAETPSGPECPGRPRSWIRLCAARVRDPKTGLSAGAPEFPARAPPELQSSQPPGRRGTARGRRGGQGWLRPVQVPHPGAAVRPISCQPPGDCGGRRPNSCRPEPRIRRERPCAGKSGAGP